MAYTIEEKTPDEGQVVIVYCPGYCDEDYQVVTFHDGQFDRVPNGDMTKYVDKWIPASILDDLF